MNGRQIGSHYDSYVPWDAVALNEGEGEQEIVVRADNTFGPHSALHIPGNDYYSYGGITRPVEAQWVPEVFIDKLFATPKRGANGWELDVRVRLRNLGASGANRRVVVELEDETARLQLGGEVEANATAEVAGVLTNLDVQAWTADNPRLYFVRVRLFEGENAVDDLRERVGFRAVEVRDAQLWLNGEPLRLRGYNRHEDHPQFGNALPPEAMATDLEILRDLGCNFVRTAHYPNDRRFLDLCDEMGFYVWEESHARQTPFSHPLFDEQITANTQEMVEWHWNHASIILWGCLNECDSTSPRGRQVYENVLGLLRRLDSSRPLTFASDKAQDDVCLDLVDIVSWNRYIGWYSGEIEEVEAYLEELLAWLDSPQSGGAGKPVIMSEFGSDGFYGYRRAHHVKGTEEYQTALLDENLRVYLNHPRVVGAAIWLFCDVRVDSECFRGRAMCMNVKGTVDEYRRPQRVL